MIDSSAGQRALERGAGVAGGPAPPPVVARPRAPPARLERRRPGRTARSTRSTRWTVAGASRPLHRPALARARPLGRPAHLDRPAHAARRPAPLVPGATHDGAAGRRRHSSLGAIGTVTYVDGATVLGFGHPFLGAGPARFLLGDGYVYETIAAPIAGASYKLAEPGTVQGMVDRRPRRRRRRARSARSTAIDGARGRATDPARGTTSTGTHDRARRRAPRRSSPALAPGRARRRGCRRHRARHPDADGSPSEPRRCAGRSSTATSTPPRAT